MSDGQDSSTFSENGGASSSTDMNFDEQEFPVKTGHCKWFNVLKGFGFITPDDGGQEVFVHQSVLRMPGFRSLDEGEPVEYQYKATPRGLEAIRVSGIHGDGLKGSRVRPMGKKRHKKIRCFNCGQYGNHIASKCSQGPLEKSCYNCKSTEHLVGNCPLMSRQPSNRPVRLDPKPNDSAVSENHVNGPETSQDEGNCCGDP